MFVFSADWCYYCVQAKVAKLRRELIEPAGGGGGGKGEGGLTTSVFVAKVAVLSLYACGWHHLSLIQPSNLVLMVDFTVHNLVYVNSFNSC